MVLLNNHKIPNKPQSWKKTTTKTCYILSAFVKCRVKSLMSSLDDNRSCFKCCPLSTLCPPLPARWCCTRTPRHIVQLKALKFYPRDGFVRASSLQRSPFYLQYPPPPCAKCMARKGGMQTRRVSSFYDILYHLLIHILIKETRIICQLCSLKGWFGEKKGLRNNVSLEFVSAFMPSPSHLPC